MKLESEDRGVSDWVKFGFLLNKIGFNCAILIIKKGLSY